MLLVEQNAAMALELADRAYVLETGVIALSGSGPRRSPRMPRCSAPISECAHEQLPTCSSQIVNGLILGSMYALIAIGFSMIYGIVRLINFAHGDVVPSAPSRRWRCVSALHAPFPLAIIVVLIVGAAVGMLIERHRLPSDARRAAGDRLHRLARGRRSSWRTGAS